MQTTAQSLRAVKEAIRSKYAWPGGYPLYIVMADGEAMSVESARAEWRQIAHSTLRGERGNWAAAGAEINWEDGELYCCHSGERIESAYAEPDNAEG